MSWLRIDDGFYEHPKVEELTDKAFRLHVYALCYCARNGTDGAVTQRTAAKLLVACGARRTHIAELVHAGLWHIAVDGHVIKDFLDYNPSAAKVKQLKEERRAAGRRGGEAKAKASAVANDVASAVANDVAIARPSASTPSRPLKELPKAVTETHYAEPLHAVPDIDRTAEIDDMTEHLLGGMP